MTKDWIWDYGMGRVERYKSLPSNVIYAPKDYSSPGYGRFMYTDFTAMDDNHDEDPMNMMSEYVPATTGSCLSFVYLPLSFSKGANDFNIILQDVNGKFSTYPSSIKLSSF